MPTQEIKSIKVGNTSYPIKDATARTALTNKVEANAAITGATKCKITYDSKGLVTSGSDLTASDIPAITLSKISDVTAVASELNILDGATISTTELNYLSGVTSNIQTQLSNKVSANAAITGATKCKITYDSKGLVTAGADLTSTDITTALGFTPYNATNPEGYISGITSSDVTTALGFTPYNATNPSEYQTAANVTSAISTHNSNYTAHQDIRNAIPTNLGDLSDVSTTGAISGQVLSYNGTSWAPATNAAQTNWGDIGGNISQQSDLDTALSSKVPTTRTVNGKALSANITLTSDDIEYTSAGTTCTYVFDLFLTAMESMGDSLGGSFDADGTFTKSSYKTSESVPLNNITDQYNFAYAIGWCDRAVGKISDLTTTAKANCVSAINELVSSKQDSLPAQSGQSGKFLTTNGSVLSWSAVDALPAQSGQSGKFLTTNGSTASWTNIPTEIPSQTGQSGKFLTTNGSSVSWSTVEALPSQTGNSGKFLITNGTTASWVDHNNNYSAHPDIRNAIPTDTSDLTNGAKFAQVTIRRL